MFLESLITDPVYFLRVILILVLSISLHELAHGWAAMLQGDDTPRRQGHLTLNPVVHLGWESLVMLCVAGIAWGQMPVNPRKFRWKTWGDVVVSAAGPLSNLGLAIAFIGLIGALHATGGDQIFSLTFLEMAAKINVLLCLFNFLPIPPLDGFHVFSPWVPGLRLLGDGPWGLFLLMFVWLTPVGDALSAIAFWSVDWLLRLV